MLAEAFAILALCLLVWHQWSHRRALRLARSLPPIPGMRALPFIGHFHYIVTRGFVGMSNVVVNAIKTVPGMQESKTYSMWVGIHPILTFFGAEDIQTILNSSSTIEKGPEVNILNYALGNGLITARGSYWKVLRRHMNPLFHSKNFNQLLPVTNACARELTFNLSQHVGKGHFDVQHHVNDAVLFSTCNLLFGPDFKVNVNSESFKKMCRSINSISSLFAVRMFKFWLWPEFIFKIWYKSLIEENDANISNYFQEPLEEFELLTQNKMETALNDEYSANATINRETADGNSQSTLITMYENLNHTLGGISKRHLKEEIFTILLASSESTRVAVSSCLLALATHPNIQDKLYTEISNSLSEKEDEVTQEHLQSMPYLDQVLKETLRWTLIIPFITRQVQRDIKLGSMTVPAGATVGVCLTAVHYDSRYYPNPKEFNPDNFLPERVAARPKSSFVPFSAGPRGCIGKNYSMMTAKTLIVHVLRKYKLSSDVEIDSLNNLAGLMFTYVEGYKLKLECRSITPSSTNL